MGSHVGGNDYTLHEGELVVAGRLTIGGNFGVNLFSQERGTNWTSELEIRPVASYPKYRLNGGLLCTSNVVLAVGYTESVFEQNGGIHIVMNTLSLLGGSDRYGTDYANYFLTDGYLSAGRIEVQASRFRQTNSITLISGTFQLGRDAETSFGQVFIESGTLACSNVSYAKAGSYIFQNGGEFIVTNLFSFGGRRNWYPPVQPQYFFSSGTLIAGDIELTADMIIGSTTQAGRITNPGYFKMAGTLTSGDANEQLGRFILASNATINLGAGSAKLSFAQSSAEDWNATAILLVTNWNGSPSGGGDDELKFGNNQSGLTQSQLDQIRFVDPAGFPSGEFPAQILNTGEVVPDAVPLLSPALGGNYFVLFWTGDFTLQTATNVSGPYEDVSGATSPHTNDMTECSERYFRLQPLP